MSETKKLLGQETEYAIIVKQGTRPADADRHLLALRRLFFRCRRTIPQKSNNDFNYFLPNGGRFYVDTGGHPEYATPECLSARQLVSYAEAGDRLLEAAAKEANRNLAEMNIPVSVVLYKNNADTNFNTWGCHENYLVSHLIFNQLLCGASAAGFFLTYLITSVIYTGAGDVVYDFCAPRAVKKSEKQLDFVLSQRGRFIGNLVCCSTTSDRGFIQTRDEAHCPEKKRLHVIGRDSNMSQLANYLKFGVCSIILDMLETRKYGTGCFSRLPVLEQPLIAFNQFLVDADLKYRAEASNGKHYTALEFQRMYFDAAMSYVNSRGGEEEKDVVQKWGETLEKLSRLKNEPHLLVGDIDWITKKFIMEKELEKIGGKSFDSLIRNVPARLRDLVMAINIQYHDLRRERGLYYRFQDRATRIVSPGEIKQAKSRAPKGLRGELRGHLVKKFGRPETAAKYDVSVNWEMLSWHKKRGPDARDKSTDTVYFLDPYEAAVSEWTASQFPPGINLPKRFVKKMNPTHKQVMCGMKGGKNNVAKTAEKRQERQGKRRRKKGRTERQKEERHG